MKKSIVLILLLSGIFSCSKKTAPTASNPPSTSASDTVATTSTPIDMMAAESLFKQTCANCHVLPQTTKHTAAEWPNTVSRMQPKGKFDDSQKTQITAYLVANARQ